MAELPSVQIVVHPCLECKWFWIESHGWWEPPDAECRNPDVDLAACLREGMQDGSTAGKYWEKKDE